MRNRQKPKNEKNRKEERFKPSEMMITVIEPVTKEKAIKRGRGNRMKSGRREWKQNG